MKAGNLQRDRLLFKFIEVTWQRPCTLNSKMASFASKHHETCSHLTCFWRWKCSSLIFKSLSLRKWNAWRELPGEQLQNTPQLIYMSLNKNSVYCVMPRSSEPPDTCKWGGPELRGILKFSPARFLDVVRAGGRRESASGTAFCAKCWVQEVARRVA